MLEKMFSGTLVPGSIPGITRKKILYNSELLKQTTTPLHYQCVGVPM
jgi:hypothetical protein